MKNELINACKANNIDGVKKFLKNKNSLKVKNQAIKESLSNGNCEIMQLLIDAGANINCDYGHLLKWSSILGKDNILKLLIKSGMDISQNDCRNITIAVSTSHNEKTVNVILDEIVKNHPDELYRLLPHLREDYTAMLKRMMLEKTQIDANKNKKQDRDNLENAMSL